ncbi:MAG: SCP2 sterol-binding domain-containing protein [Candidatus Hermodarchaeota archaeon]
MANAEDLKNSLENWAKKLEDPEIAEEFEDFNKTMQFIFPDINYNLQLIFENKKARVEEGFNENAEMSLEVESNLFLGISTGEIDPMEAFMDGTLKPKGTMSDLERLEIFMDDFD